MLPTDDPNSDPVPDPSTPDADEILEDLGSTVAGVSEAARRRQPPTGWFRKSFTPFRNATLRGLAVLLPPLLTIIFFVWAWNAIDRAILRPVEGLARDTIVWFIDDSKDDKQVQELAAASQSAGFKSIDGERIFVDDQGKAFVKIQKRWVPMDVRLVAETDPGFEPMVTPRDHYERYVELRYLKRHLVIPAFLALFLALMYLLGKVLAAGVGRIIYSYTESLINRLPLIRNVYSSVKQVTDFVVGDNELQYTRVVAVEYPRRGVWSIGFVTGDSLLDIRNAAGEPMLTVLMPTSPMPATGFTISVPKSETIDLDMTLDQAVQFCVSGGVVVPEHQIIKSSLEGEVRRRIGESLATGEGVPQSQQPKAASDDPPSTSDAS